jgi:hypothetical protein
MREQASFAQRPIGGDASRCIDRPSHARVLRPKARFREIDRLRAQLDVFRRREALSGLLER